MCIISFLCLNMYFSHAFPKSFQDSFRIYHLRTLNAQICVANCEADMKIFYQISENIDLAYM